MMDAMGLGVIFQEQVIHYKWHRHTVIECIPVPQSLAEDAPAYFKEAIFASEDEWSQHKKLIISDKGFRRSLTSKLPYFHVWLSLDTGYGHIIEQPQEWNPWFGKEVIASVLDLSPEFWRKPRMADLSELDAQNAKFLLKWKPFNWTLMLEDGN